MKSKMFKSRAPEPLSTVPETLREVVAVGTSRALSLWLTDVDHDLMGNQIDDLDVPQAERLTELLTPASARELRVHWGLSGVHVPKEVATAGSRGAPRYVGCR